jgi:hypothetical protein
MHPTAEDYPAPDFVEFVEDSDLANEEALGETVETEKVVEAEPIGYQPPAYSDIAHTPSDRQPLLEDKL